jgi:hypothetical protein
MLKAPASERARYTSEAKDEAKNRPQGRPQQKQIKNLLTLGVASA